jgi:DDE superfamily endonuclease
MEVMQWVEKHKGKMELFFLPAYAPQLNPDEYFNQDIKTNAVGKHSPRTRDQLERTVRAFATAKKKSPEKIKAYFHPQPVSYSQ